MPNIEQPYDAGPLKLQPDETGIEATAQAARRINAAYTEVGQAKEKTQEQLARGLSNTVRDAGTAALDYMQHREISHGAAAFATKMQQVTDDWNDTVKNADPNNPLVAKDFLAKLEPDLQEFKRGFLTEGGQQWAEQRLDAFRNHMFEKTSADMSTLAQDAVAVNFRQTVNKLSNTARTDASSIGFLIDTAQHSINEIVASSPNIKGAAAAKVKAQLTEQAIESIVQSGAMGAIETAADPDAAARALAAKYPQYINGAELQKLVSAARQQVRMRRLEDTTVQNQQHTQNIRAANNVANQNFIDNTEIDADTGQIHIKPGFFEGARKLAMMPDAPHGLAEQQVNWGQSLVRRGDLPVKDEPVRVSELAQRIFDPDAPTTRLELMKANAAGIMSDKTFHRLDRLVTEVSALPKDPAFRAGLTAARQQLIANVPGLPGSHPQGAARYAAFILDFQEAYSKAKRTGDLPANATDASDPKSMISQFIKAHDVPASQKLSEYMQSVRELAAQVEVPNEAAAGALPAGTPFRIKGTNRTGTSTGPGAK